MNSAQVKVLATGMFRETYAKKVAENFKDIKVGEVIAANSADLLKRLAEKVKANAEASVPEGLTVEKVTFLVSFAGDGTKITMMPITIKNTITSAKSFKFRKVVNVDEGMLDSLVEFLGDVYESLVVDCLMQENVDVVNAVLEEITQGATDGEDAGIGLDYKIKFVISSGDGKKVDYLSDNEVVFVADPDRVFELNDILALYTPDENFTEEDIEASKKVLRDSLLAFPTPAQLVKGKNEFISYITNMQSKKFATILKGITKQKAETAAEGKIGYVTDGDAFALVANRDGEYEYVLSPVNMSTGMREDVDLLSKLK